MRAARAWSPFAAWAISGGLLFFSWLSGLTIGLFVFPFALLACWATARRWRTWPPLLGVLAGAGLVCLAGAAVSRDYDLCRPSGTLTIQPGETSVECGGTDPLPWLVAGIVLVALGVLAYAFAVGARPSRPARRRLG